MSGTLAEGFARLYLLLLPVGQIAFTGCLLILLPMALVRSTRRQAGYNLILSSYLFGAITWALGASVSWSVYGWLGLLLGLFFFGVGVVPIAIFAAFFTLHMPSLGVSLFVMSVLTYGVRYGGTALVAYAEAASSEEISVSETK